MGPLLAQTQGCLPEEKDEIVPASTGNDLLVSSFPE